MVAMVASLLVAVAVARRLNLVIQLADLAVMAVAVWFVFILGN
jgi:hypothetical protein